jgi:hypothetical protein
VRRLRVRPLEATSVGGVDDASATVTIRSFDTAVRIAGPGIADGVRVALLPRFTGVTCEAFPHWDRAPFSVVFTDANNTVVTSEMSSSSSAASESLVKALFMGGV